MSSTETTSPRPPLACYWVQEPDGTRWLVPGCVARLYDSDADACTCLTLAQQIVRHRTSATRRSAPTAVCVTERTPHRAVNAHPEGVKIMKDAAERAARN
ncbi:hypothetical protein ACWD4T_03965 [Streptomyces umbrinus]